MKATCRNEIYVHEFHDDFLFDSNYDIYQRTSADINGLNFQAALTLSEKSNKKAANTFITVVSAKHKSESLSRQLRLLPDFPRT